nr:glycosyltransferase family 4 protein [Acinetobacter baumannii]
MMRICFLIGNMNLTGGTERVTSLIANSFSQEEDYEVYILSLFEGDRPQFLIDDNIHLFSLFSEKKSMKTMFLLAIWKIRKFLLHHKINTLIVVDSISSFFTVPATRGLKIKHICWEHFNLNTNLGSVFRDIGRLLAILFCDYIVTLTISDKRGWKNRFKSASDKIIYIPNPSAFKSNDFYPSIEEKCILAVGRLSYEKGFDLLLEAWALVSNKDNWKLKIVGSGEELENLWQLTLNLSVQDTVVFEPANINIQEYYQKASFLCLPSRIEGFGMVIVEAQTFGLPVIAFDIETGPKEIIKNDTGFLVKPFDTTAFAEKIYEYMNMSQQNLNLMGKKCKENIKRFDNLDIVESWKRII